MAATKGSTTRKQPTEAEKAAKAEQRRAKFVELVNRRANKVVDSIAVLTKLSAGNYEYTDADTDKVFAILEQQLAASKAKFSQPTKRSKREPITFV